MTRSNQVDRRGGEPTPMERACLYLLERPGATYASVAAQLGIAEATVRSHISHVLAKTGANTTQQAQAVVEARWPVPGAS